MEINTEAGQAALPLPSQDYSCYLRKTTFLMDGVGRSSDSAFMTCHHALTCLSQGMLELNRGSWSETRIEKVEVMGYRFQSCVCLSSQCRLLFVSNFHGLTPPLPPQMLPSSCPSFCSSLLAHNDRPRLCTPAILSFHLSHLLPFPNHLP